MTETPELPDPCDADILAALSGGSRCLQDLCGTLWPRLPWLASLGGDASSTPRMWARQEAPFTAAEYLLARLRALLAQGLVRPSLFVRGRPGIAGISYGLAPARAVPTMI